MWRLSETVVWYKKWLWKIISFVAVPACISTIGFVYLGQLADVKTFIAGMATPSIKTLLFLIIDDKRFSATVFVVATGCALWSGLGSWLTIKHQQGLQRDADAKYAVLHGAHRAKAVNVPALLRRYLSSYARRLHFGSNERISLYRRDAEKFICIGCFSENPGLEQMSEPVASGDDGWLAYIWLRGAMFDVAAPDPHGDWRGYVRHHRDRYRATEAQLQHWTMRSRTLRGIRLGNAAAEIVALIVFESLTFQHFVEREIDAAFDRHEKFRLVVLIEALRLHMPHLTTAMGEGI